jgi:ribosomal protein L40E
MGNWFDMSGMVLVGIIVLVVVLLVATAVQHRRHSAQTDQRLCRSCGTSHPAFAEYCRRCGKRL